MSDKRFFSDGIVNPEKIETIEISNTDMSNQSIDLLEPFTKLKYLKLENLKNSSLDHLEFLKNNANLLKIEIQNNPIFITELNHLINAKCTKNIVANIMDEKGKIIENCQFQIAENISEMTLCMNDLEEIAKEVNLYKIKKIKIIVTEATEKNSYAIKFLKKLKCELHIMLHDFSSLNSEQAQKMKDTLKLEKVEFINQKEKTELNIEDYINIRNEIEKIVQKVSANSSHVEKFLEIYRILGKEFTISEEKADIKNKTCTTLQLCQLLQNCLKCMDISSHLIFGDELENDKKHYWNQVELDGKWYHVDLALDMENIKKNKAEYCLLGDKDFLETHTPKSGKNNYCAENFNPKMIHVFFKTGLFKENLVTSYIESIVEKIKKLFHFNKTQEILTLPEAKTDENNKN